VQDRADTSRTSRPSRPVEELVYRIELWRDGRVDQVERVLARAASVELARAIFKAALTEHPGRRITLRKGSRTLGDSSR
jgi:hypothetical protein